MGGGKDGLLAAQDLQTGRTRCESVAYEALNPAGGRDSEAPCDPSSGRVEPSDVSNSGRVFVLTFA